jgi:DNA-binding NarL/FixJ family response regulator
MKTQLKTETIAKDEHAGTIQVPDGLLNITMGKPAQYSPFANDSLCSHLNRKSKPITVLLAEHRTIVRQGICAVLALEEGIRIIGEAPDGCQAAELTEKLHPDVVVISAAMACGNHMVAIRQILLALPAPRVIVLARDGDDVYAREAAKLGAAGYVTEQISAQMLGRTLRETCKGACVFSPGISRYLPEKPRACSATASFTKRLSLRQRQVLQLIAEGNSNKQTASNLSISIKTVEKHRQRLMDSLGIHETAGLTRYALSSRIIEG